jgi:hypothetical protein
MVLKRLSASICPWLESDSIMRPASLGTLYMSHRLFHSSASASVTECSCLALSNRHDNTEKARRRWGIESWPTLTGDTMISSRRLEVKCRVGTHCPSGYVRPPDVRGAQSQPLKLPELVQEIQHDPTMNLIEVLHGESRLQIPE